MSITNPNTLRDKRRNALAALVNVPDLDEYAIRPRVGRGQYPRG